MRNESSAGATKDGDGGLSRRARWAGGQSVVTRLMAQALAHPELASLAAGFVDEESLPVEPTRLALRWMWSEAGRAQAALQYGTTIGYPPLRQAVLDRLLEADGQTADAAHASVEQVVVTAGSNELLHLVADTLCDPGDIVLCGEPTYYVFLGTLANLGVRAVGVTSDDGGLVLEALEEQLARLHAAGKLARVKAIYVTTWFDNPTGLSLAEDRRGALVEIARRWSIAGRIYVLEDAAYRELRYEGFETPSVRSFDSRGDTVIYAGTFSKSYSPGMRVGWGLLPPALVEPVLAQKGNIDFGAPNLNQHVMAAVLEQGLFEAHVEALREAYREKAVVMLAALDAALGPLPGVHWVHPRGGLYVWIRLPPAIDAGLEGPLFAAAVDEGVLYVPGDACYPDRARAPRNMLRLSFGSPSGETIRRGVAALGRAVARVLP